MKEFLFCELQAKAFSIMFFMDSYKYLCNKFLLEFNASEKKVCYDVLSLSFCPKFYWDIINECHYEFQLCSIKV